MRAPSRGEPRLTARSQQNVGENGPGLKPSRGALLFWFCFALSVLLVIRGIFAGVANFPPQPWQTSIGVMNKILPGLEAMGDPPASPALVRIAMLGDSTVDFYPKNQKIPDRIEAALQESAPAPPDIEITNLAFLGLGPTAYYFLADRIAGAKPDLVIWQVSLTHASERWRGSLLRPQLAGWLPPDRIPSALTLPLDAIGLTVDELLFYSLIVQTGQAERWQDWLINLSRVDKARGDLDAWLGNSPEGGPEKNFAALSALIRLTTFSGHPERPDRYNDLGEIDHFGSVLEGIGPEHPTLRFIAAAVGVFSEAGIPTLVYLNPINLEHLDAVGVLDKSAMERSVDAYRSSVVDNGGLFLDYHDIFPDSHFADMAGHFRHDDEIQTQTQLAEKIAGFISENKLLGPDLPIRKEEN